MLLAELRPSSQHLCLNESLSHSGPVRCSFQRLIKHDQAAPLPTMFGSPAKKALNIRQMGFPQRSKVDGRFMLDKTKLFFPTPHHFPPYKTGTNRHPSPVVPGRQPPIPVVRPGNCLSYAMVCLGYNKSMERSIPPGDVICFHMNINESWASQHRHSGVYSSGPLGRRSLGSIMGI